MASSTSVDADAGLGRDHHRVGGVDADHVLDLLLDLVGLGGGQVDLVQDRHDLVVGVERLIDVGERLRLDALAGVDHQQRAFAGRQRARDLVGEVDMAGRVHQVEDVGLAVLGLVVQPHGLRLDGDAALALDIHRIEHLLLAAISRSRAARRSSGSGGRPASICHGRYGRRWRSCGCWKWGRMSWARDSIAHPAAATIMRVFRRASSRQADSTCGRKRATHGAMSTASFLPAASRARRWPTVRRVAAWLAAQRLRSQGRPLAGDRLCRRPCGALDPDPGQSQGGAGRPYGRRGSLSPGARSSSSAMASIRRCPAGSPASGSGCFRSPTGRPMRWRWRRWAAAS